MFANANKPVTRLVLGAFSFSKQSRGRIIRRQQRCMGVSTTVNPEYDADSFILRTEKEEYIPECTLPEVVWENLGKWADKPALVRQLIFCIKRIPCGQILTCCSSFLTSLPVLLKRIK